MILVTGASGFIGKHLIKSLVQNYGASNILALTSAPLQECPYLLHSGFNFEPDYFVSAGYDKINTIIHAGAFIPKIASQLNDVHNCTNNIFTTSKLLDAVFPQLKKIIFISSIDVYQDAKIISENTFTTPATLYGDSKLYSEKMIEAWAVQKNIQHQVLRIGHVYGPGEEAYQKIIPLTIKKLINAQEIEIWGSGKEIRSFIYIDDVIKAIIASITLENKLGPINVVSSQQISINQLINQLIKVSNKNLAVKHITSNHQQRDLVFDNSKMKAHLCAEETPLTLGLQQEFDYMRGLLQQ